MKLTPPPINQLLNQYPLHIIPEIQSNWIEFSSSKNSDPVLISNYLRYRLAHSWPLANGPLNLLGAHHTLINFVRGVLNHFYGHTSIRINVSPAILLLNNDSNNYSVLYASHNYHFFDTSQVIHNVETRNVFLERLSTINLQEKMDEAKASLTGKYDDFTLFPISLFFSITRLPEVIFGASNGLRRCCHLKETTNPPSSDCVFRALSVFLLPNGQKRIKPGLSRTHVAKRLKKNFEKYLKIKKIPFSNIFSESGLNTTGVNLLEDFLDIGLNILAKYGLYKNVLKRNSVQKTKQIKNTVLPIRISDKKNCVYLSCRKTKVNDESLICHVDAITDIDKYAGKYFCNNCQYRFSSSFGLTRHKKNNPGLSCAKPKQKFLANKVVSQPQNVFSLAKEYVGAEMPVDGKAALVALKSANNEQSIDLTIALTNDTKIDKTEKRQFKNVYDTAYFCVFFLSLVKDIELPLRLKNALFFINTLEMLQNEHNSQCANIQKSSVSWETNEQRIYKNLKTFICNFLSNYQIFVFSSETDSHLQEKFLKTFLEICLINDDGKNKQIQIRNGRIAKLCVRNFQIFSSNFIVRNFLKINNLSFSEIFSQFLDLCSQTKQIFNINILSGQTESLTSISKIFFTSDLSIAHLASVVSPPKELYDKIQQTMRYGVLMAKSCLIHRELSIWKSYFSLDFKKYYLNIAKHHYLMGKPMIYEQTPNKNFKRKERSIPHKTFSNILFILMELLIFGHFHYQAHGSEIKFKNLPCDCIMEIHQPLQKGKNKRIIHVFTYLGKNLMCYSVCVCVCLFVCVCMCVCVCLCLLLLNQGQKP